MFKYTLTIGEIGDDEMYVVDNAIIMAAGTSSRFAPLSYEKPKALIDVKGEVLIERQIRQLKEAGISDIYIVVGYKAEMFMYLEDKLGVHVVKNPDYLIRNNHSSIYVVKDILKNTYICSADNYFSENPFENEVPESYYAAVFSNGPTKEWCMETDDNEYISNVTIGGENAWYMLGHAFWSENFSKRFVEILEEEYMCQKTINLFWENIYINHINDLRMKIRKYEDNVIFEFDTLDELREFDKSYIDDTCSQIIKDVVVQLNCQERDICQVNAYKNDTNEAAGFSFVCGKKLYEYSYDDKILRRK